MILQFGKIPPPIGGISIHIQRLLEEFENTSIKMELLDYSKERNIISIVSKIWSSEIIHVHLSRKLHRLVIIILFRILFKKVVVTFHGEFDFINKYDFYSLKFASFAILLNQISFNHAKIYRKKRLILIGAYIPPKINPINSLKEASIKQIESLKRNFKHVFCTNAWNVAFDKNGNEIYGGTLLIDVLANNPDIALVFSDPASNYWNFLNTKFKTLPSNVLFLNYKHDFIDVIMLCDAFIRSTTTDGDSLSIHEALHLKRDVIASNVIDRPLGCILFTNKVDLEMILRDFNRYKGCYNSYVFNDNIPNLKDVYLNI